MNMKIEECKARFFANRIYEENEECFTYRCAKYQIRIFADEDAKNSLIEMDEKVRDAISPYCQKCK